MAPPQVVVVKVEDLRALSTEFRSSYLSRESDGLYIRCSLRNAKEDLLFPGPMAAGRTAEGERTGDCLDFHSGSVALQITRSTMLHISLVLSRVCKAVAEASIALDTIRINEETIRCSIGLRPLSSELKANQMITGPCARLHLVLECLRESQQLSNTKQIRHPKPSSLQLHLGPVSAANKTSKWKATLVLMAAGVQHEINDVSTEQLVKLSTPSIDIESLQIKLTNVDEDEAPLALRLPIIELRNSTKSKWSLGQTKTAGKVELYLKVEAIQEEALLSTFDEISSSIKPAQISRTIVTRRRSCINNAALHGTICLRLLDHEPSKPLYASLSSAAAAKGIALPSIATDVSIPFDWSPDDPSTSNFCLLLSNNSGEIMYYFPLDALVQIPRATAKYVLESTEERALLQMNVKCQEKRGPGQVLRVTNDFAGWIHISNWKVQIYKRILEDEYPQFRLEVSLLTDSPARPEDVVVDTVDGHVVKTNGLSTNVLVVWPSESTASGLLFPFTRLGDNEFLPTSVMKIQLLSFLNSAPSKAPEVCATAYLPLTDTLLHDGLTPDLRLALYADEKTMTRYGELSLRLQAVPESTWLADLLPLPHTPKQAHIVDGRDESPLYDVLRIQISAARLLAHPTCRGRMDPYVECALLGMDDDVSTAQFIKSSIATSGTDTHPQWLNEYISIPLPSSLTSMLRCSPTKQQDDYNARLLFRVRASTVSEKDNIIGESTLDAPLSLLQNARHKPSKKSWLELGRGAQGGEIAISYELTRPTVRYNDAGLARISYKGKRDDLIIPITPDQLPPSDILQDAKISDVDFQATLCDAVSNPLRVTSVVTDSIRLEATYIPHFRGCLRLSVADIDLDEAKLEDVMKVLEPSENTLPRRFFLRFAVPGGDHGRTATSYCGLAAWRTDKRRQQNDKNCIDLFIDSFRDFATEVGKSTTAATLEVSLLDESPTWRNRIAIGSVSLASLIIDGRRQVTNSEVCIIDPYTRIQRGSIIVRSRFIPLSTEAPSLAMCSTVAELKQTFSICMAEDRSTPAAFLGKMRQAKSRALQTIWPHLSNRGLIDLMTQAEKASRIFFKEAEKADKCISWHAWITLLWTGAMASYLPQIALGLCSCTSMEAKTKWHPQIQERGEYTVTFTLDFSFVYASTLAERDVMSIIIDTLQNTFSARITKHKIISDSERNDSNSFQDCGAKTRIKFYFGPFPEKTATLIIRRIEDSVLRKQAKELLIKHFGSCRFGKAGLHRTSSATLKANSKQNRSSSRTRGISGDSSDTFLSEHLRAELEIIRLKEQRNHHIRETRNLKRHIRKERCVREAIMHASLGFRSHDRVTRTLEKKAAGSALNAAIILEQTQLKEQFAELWQTLSDSNLAADMPEVTLSQEEATARTNAPMSWVVAAREGVEVEREQHSNEVRSLRAEVDSVLLQAQDASQMAHDKAILADVAQDEAQKQRKARQAVESQKADAYKELEERRAREFHRDARDYAARVLQKFKIDIHRQAQHEREARERMQMHFAVLVQKYIRSWLARHQIKRFRKSLKTIALIVHFFMRKRRRAKELDSMTPALVKLQSSIRSRQTQNEHFIKKQSATRLALLWRAKHLAKKCRSKVDKEDRKLATEAAARALVADHERNLVTSVTAHQMRLTRTSLSQDANRAATFAQVAQYSANAADTSLRLKRGRGLVLLINGFIRVSLRRMSTAFVHWRRTYPRRDTSYEDALARKERLIEAASAGVADACATETCCQEIVLEICSSVFDACREHEKYLHEKLAKEIASNCLNEVLDANSVCLQDDASIHNSEATLHKAPPSETWSSPTLYASFVEESSDDSSSCFENTIQLSSENLKSTWPRTIAATVGRRVLVVDYDDDDRWLRGIIIDYDDKMEEFDNKPGVCVEYSAPDHKEDEWFEIYSEDVHFLPDM